MANSAIISGYIERNAELKLGKGDVYFVAFSVKSEGTYQQSSTGKPLRGVNFHRIVVYGNQEWLTNWLMDKARANAFVEIHGEIRNTSFPDRDYPDRKVRLQEIVAYRQGITFPQLTKDRSVS